MGRKRQVSKIDLHNVPFFQENRLLATPEELDLLQEKLVPLTLHNTRERWLDQVWNCMDDVVRLLEWREISTKPVHISRCLSKVQRTEDADLFDARSLLRRNEPTDAASAIRKQAQLYQESLLFVNARSGFINDDKWCMSVAAALCQLLAVLGAKKIAMNILAFLELVSMSSKDTFRSDEKKMYIGLVGFELYARAPIPVLRGEETW